MLVPLMPVEQTGFKRGVQNKKKKNGFKFKKRVKCTKGDSKKIARNTPCKNTCLKLRGGDITNKRPQKRPQKQKLSCELRAEYVIQGDKRSK